MIRRLQTSDTGFQDQLEALLRGDVSEKNQVREIVSGVIAGVRERGDTAVLEYTAKFDNLDVKSVAALEVTKDRLQRAFDGIDPLVSGVLHLLSAGVDHQRGDHRAQRRSAFGGRFHLHHPFFQHALSTGQVPDGYGDVQRRGRSGRTPA